LIKKDYIKQRLIHLDATVVIDKSQFAKAIHKKAHAGARGADHFRQRLL
jgi:hypothetical protein